MTKRSQPKQPDVISPHFLDFIECLNARDVAYLLVGGYALGAHGVIRATRDIDFLYRPTERNVDALCAALIDFGAPSNVIDKHALLDPAIVTQIGQPPNRIDLMGEISGVTFAEAWKGSIEATISGATLRVIGLEELCKNKAATGCKKDADDLKKLNRRRAGRAR